MFNRPRCRDWTPLASQQLRLRNLIKITGQNIVCNVKCQLYFTLHSTAMSAPFYTSEKVDSHGGNMVTWPEINCQLILKSTSRCVCVRVWEHLPSSIISETKTTSMTIFSISDENDLIQNGSIDDNSTDFASLSSLNTDKMLFIWGVYFSGLILLTKRSEASFLSNSLIFQMHGGCFASPESLTQDTMYKQLTITYKLDQGLLSTASSPTNSLKNNSTAGTSCEELLLGRTATKSCDIFSSSNNLINNDLISPKQESIIKTGSSSNTVSNEFQINSPRNSRSCSPVSNERICKSTINMDLSRDLLGMLKVRYLDKRFLNSEIRPSYILDKLLKLQEKQRKFKHKSEDAKEITEKICMRSAFCLNLDLITTNKNIFYHHRLSRGNPSMGRTLNRLLFQETHIKPEDILRAQDLRRRIETARFRSRLLFQERDKTKLNIRHLERKLTSLHDSNIELGSWLMTSYRNLSREKDILSQKKTTLAVRLDTLVNVNKSLTCRRTQLLNELKDIYPIDIQGNTTFTINNIVLPEANIIPKKDERLLDPDFITWDSITPLSLSIALGYVAHVVQISSIILNLPLRNPIKHEGSRSRIMDIIKEIPTNREFPLYSRTHPLPKAVIYAIYLINQNIAQLNFQFNGIRCDLRATLPNLLRLLTGPLSSYLYINNENDANSRLLNEHHITTSMSGSSVDLNVPPPTNIPTSKPLGIVDTKMNDQRISRSVGSYTDEHLSPAGGKSFYSSSEPILTIQAVHISNFNENGDI